MFFYDAVGLRRGSFSRRQVSILRGLKERYEVHHGVRLQDAALVSAAQLSHRYIADRFLPDKAIDLVDEAAAKLNIEASWSSAASACVILPSIRVIRLRCSYPLLPFEALVGLCQVGLLGMLLGTGWLLLC